MLIVRNGSSNPYVRRHFRIQELLAEIETLSAHVGDSHYTIVVTMSSLKMVST